MSVMDIRRAGDPVLKQKAKPVSKITKTVRTLLDNMSQTMQDADGVGLAAPQVGVSLRVIVIDVGEGLIELINPAIIESEGCETSTEGCLSIPGMYGEVERFTSVTVQGMDRQGNLSTIMGTGLLARALQHEIDHLEGVLFIERAQSLYKERKE
ncbi:MAG: peptide deformylase [Negativicutes bacterium]